MGQRKHMLMCIAREGGEAVRFYVKRPCKRLICSMGVVAVVCTEGVGEEKTQSLELVLVQ